MVSDANIALQASTTKTSTFSSTAVSIGDTPRRGMYARVIATAASAASGSAILQYSLDVSYDGGSTFKATQFQGPQLTLTTTSSVFEQSIPFEVSRTVPGTPVQVRVVATLGSTSGSGHTFTYQVDVVPGRPG